MSAGLPPCTRRSRSRSRSRSNVNGRSWLSEGRRGAVGLRGRRKPIHGGLVAASMRLTPRKPTVPRLRQVHGAVGGCRPLVGTSVRYRMNHPRMAWIYWHCDCWGGRLLVGVDLGRHRASAASDPLLLFFISFPWLDAAGNCQRLGGVGLQDRWRHGWRHRAPRDGFTACPASPHRPAKPAENQSRFCI